MLGKNAVTFLKKSPYVRKALLPVLIETTDALRWKTGKPNYMVHLISLQERPSHRTITQGAHVIVGTRYPIEKAPVNFYSLLDPVRSGEVKRLSLEARVGGTSTRGTLPDSIRGSSRSGPLLVQERHIALKKGHWPRRNN